MAASLNPQAIMIAAEATPALVVTTPDDAQVIKFEMGMSPSTGYFDRPPQGLFMSPQLHVIQASPIEEENDFASRTPTASSSSSLSNSHNGASPSTSVRPFPGADKEGEGQSTPVSDAPSPIPPRSLRVSSLFSMGRKSPKLKRPSTAVEPSSNSASVAATTPSPASSLHRSPSTSSKASFWRFGSRTTSTSRPQTASSADPVLDPNALAGRSLQKSDTFISTASAGSIGNNSINLPTTESTSCDSLKSSGSRRRSSCRGVATEAITVAPKPVKVKTRGKGLKNVGLDRIFLAQEVPLTIPSPPRSNSGGPDSTRSSLSRRESRHHQRGTASETGRRASVRRRSSGKSSEEHSDFGPGPEHYKAVRAASFVDPCRPPMPHVESNWSVLSAGSASTFPTSVASSECHSPMQSPSKNSIGLPPVPSATPSSTRTSAASATQKSPSKASSTWALKFSQDGRYLAAAGSDCIIRVFEVIASPSDREDELEQARLASLLASFGSGEKSPCLPCSPHVDDDKRVNTDSVKSNKSTVGAPVFRRHPIREFAGHTNDILDLCWSKNHFLLSCSSDKSAKVWHPSRPDCLCTFAMPDMVTSAAFHPTDDRYIISGSLDGKLRLWNVSEQKLQDSIDVPGMITAVSFTASGRTACVGTYNGAALFYECGAKFRYTNSIPVRSKGKSTAAKITGIAPVFVRGEREDKSERIMITSNDSRIRFYSIKDRRLVHKLKAPTYLNRSSQIKASLSDDGAFAVSGSEDSAIYIWDASRVDDPTPVDKKDESPCLWWPTNSGPVTAAVMAPRATNRLLEEAGDPIESRNPAKDRIIVSVDKAGVLKVWRADSAGPDQP